MPWILWLSDILGHGVGGLISQCGRTMKSLWVHTITNLYLSWYDLRWCKDGEQQPIVSWLTDPEAPIPGDATSPGKLKVHVHQSHSQRWRLVPASDWRDRLHTGTGSSVDCQPDWGQYKVWAARRTPLVVICSSGGPMQFFLFFYNLLCFLSPCFPSIVVLNGQEVAMEHVHLRWLRVWMAVGRGWEWRRGYKT